MMLADLGLLTCLAATLSMTGLIWFVQVVHYPLFGRIGLESFAKYHSDHSRLVSHVVIGPMTIEVVTSLILVFRRPDRVGPILVWAGLLASAVTWASTAIRQVPEHRRLSTGWSPEAGRSLVRSNWIRTAAWTLHSAIVLVMMASRIGLV